MAETIASKTIVFIHGLFMNPESWNDWKKHFEAKGFLCHAPAYPFHEGQPAALRSNPDPGLGKITFGNVIDSLAAFISTLPEKPILIGHSMGGLAVQKLVSMNKAAAGICIDSAAPKGIISLKGSFLRSNLPVINPLKGSSVFHPTVSWFQYAFCNTMKMEDAQKVFDAFVVPESRNIPRTSTGADGKIDFSQPHAPLLFIAGELDHIIPASLNLKNFNAYSDPGSRRDFHQFKGRTHYICGQENWKEVADYCLEWLNK